MGGRVLSFDCLLLFNMIGMNRIRRECLGSIRTRVMNDIFYNNRYVELDQEQRKYDSIIIKLPSNENYLMELQKRNEKQHSSMIETINTWEKSNKTKMTWSAFGVKSRIQVGIVMKKMKPLNLENSIFNELNGETILRCDIFDTEIIISIKNFEKIDENWDVKMIEELYMNKSGLIDDMCSILVAKKQSKKQDHQYDEYIDFNSDIDTYNDLWMDQNTVQPSDDSLMNDKCDISTAELVKQLRIELENSGELQRQFVKSARIQKQQQEKRVENMPETKKQQLKQKR